MISKTDISIEVKDKTHSFVVEYDVDYSEPDVGFYGNGDQAVSIESIALKFGNRLRYLNLPFHSWIYDYIANELYEGFR